MRQHQRLHLHEQDRLESLRSYDVLGTPDEPAFDALTRLAALLCAVPIAGISLVGDDRQWFKSTHGFATRDTPRDISFASDVVADGKPIVVYDATLEPRYADNPQVTGGLGIRAYAAMPLIGRDGLPLGALCVVDVRPRHFTKDQLEGLQLLAGQVVTQLELRRADRDSGRGDGTLLGEASDPVRLRRALDDGELRPHFQPMVDLRSRRTLGFEALLRWHHPQHGLLPPGVFLPAVESSGLMLPVGRRVLDLSLAMLAELRAEPGLPDLLGVAVNVSGAQLRQPGLAQVVLASLDHHAIPAGHLSVELTETAILFETSTARRELMILRDAGVHVALDDYGTGWSSLSRLLDLPLSALKLDRILVAGLPGDERCTAVARSTFALCAEMGIDVVCEGIETEEQRRSLLAMGAKYGQGWLFGRPMDRSTVLDLMRSEAAVLAPVPKVRPLHGRGQLPSATHG
jgi:EAL domain-containing protein (putative c-di-GMP-specific phosphodiesterase class I)